MSPGYREEFCCLFIWEFLSFFHWKLFDLFFIVCQLKWSISVFLQFMSVFSSFFTVYKRFPTVYKRFLRFLLFISVFFTVYKCFPTVHSAEAFFLPFLDVFLLFSKRFPVVFKSFSKRLYAFFLLWTFEGVFISFRRPRLLSRLCENSSMLQVAIENDYCPTKQQKRLLESTEICTAVTKRNESASTVTLNASTCILK